MYQPKVALREFDPSPSNTEDVVKALIYDGGVVIRALLASETLDSIEKEVRPFIEADKPWKGCFFPPETRRVCGLAGKSRVFMEKVMADPLYQAVCDALLTSTYHSFYGQALEESVSKPQLNNTIVFSIGPGASNQQLHRDDMKHGRDTGIGFFVAGNKTTRENGATRFIPGSHLWATETPDAKVPRTANFNPINATGVSWIHDLPHRNQSVVDYNDHYYRQRLRALQGVDELVDSLITRLEDSGKLDNTFIIYTSDNGFHISQHRLPPGKTCRFEEDIRVPFMIRGPGIPENHVENTVTTHIDIAPTLFQLAGMPLRSDFDGTPMPTSKTNGSFHEHVTVEYWGQGMLEGGLSNLGTPTVPNNTYKAVRLLAEDYNIYYSVWCNNEHELYDLATDPYQINNLWTSKSAPATLLGYSVADVTARLDTLLLVLKSCVGVDCIKPWNVLHPDGSVQSLRDALHSEYDSSYHEQPKVSFDRCAYGYEIDAEGPQHAFSHRNGYSVEAWI